MHWNKYKQRTLCTLCHCRVRSIEHSRVGRDGGRVVRECLRLAVVAGQQAISYIAQRQR